MGLGALRKRLSDRLGGRAGIMGHRGAMGHRPENTRSSFEHAVALGADLVETDVHLSRDGHLVAIHDETLDRTTDGTGFVRDTLLADLQRLDAGCRFGDGRYAGERILTLDDVLAWAHAAGVMVAIEVKNGPLFYDGIEQAILDALQRHTMIEAAIVVAFDHPTVQRLKALHPAVATGILYACRPADPVGLARAAGADALLPHWAYVTADDVATAHGAGLVVAPWVTSEPRVLAALLAAGVDAIGTNHPDVLRNILQVRAA